MDIVLKSAKSALAFVPSVGKNNAADEKNENWGKYHLPSIVFMNSFYAPDLVFKICYIQ